MDLLINKLKHKYNDNRTLLFFCIISTFIFGLITHAYMFFQDSFSHDCLNEIDAGVFGNEWKVQLGRFVVPLYRILTRGNITLPWLIGIVSLFWIALSVFLVVRIFDIKQKCQIVLTAGIMVSNIAVISNTATYINDLDSNMFAVFLSVCAVFLWKKYKYGFFVSILCVAGVMGLYQAYVSVTIVLVIMYLVLELLKGRQFKEVFLSGIKSVVALAAGGGIYFVVFKAVLLITGITQVEGSYNSMDQLGGSSVSEMISMIVYTFKTTVYSFFFPKNAVSKNLVMVLVGLSFLCCAGIVIVKLLNKKIGWLEKALALVLIGVMPIGMSFVEIVTGQKHDLMRYADWLIFVFLLLVSDKVFNKADSKKLSIQGALASAGKIVSVITVTVILLGNVVSANEIYLKKDLEQQSNLVLFTRVVDRMDSLEEYDRKTTPVVFIGRPDYYNLNEIGLYNRYWITGTVATFVVGVAGSGYYQRYFDYKLHYPIIVAEDKDFERFSKKQTVQEMPVFPLEGCMKIVDGVLVVKLGEIT